MKSDPNKPLKVLRVISDIYPVVVGGLPVHVHEMSKEQARLGCVVTVYTGKAAGQVKKETVHGYHVTRFTPLVKIMGNAILPGLLPKLLSTEKKYDVVHAHSHLFFSTNMCALARHITGKPLVITNHGLISQTVPEWISGIYTPTIAKWTFQSADKILCYAEEEKDRLLELGIKADKIVVIHNGVNTDVFSPGEKTSSVRQLLWVGRFAPGKGLEYLIDSFQVLLKEYPDLKLLMVGVGPVREDIWKKVEDMGLTTSVSIKDSIPNSEISKTYRDSSIFVLPSINEGVPRSILEAMACGIPVVCTDLPQLLKVVSGCGLMVPVKDAQALSEAIGRILSDPEYAKELGAHGREKAVKEYSWEDTVRKTIKVYEKLCQR